MKVWKVIVKIQCDRRLLSGEVIHHLQGQGHGDGLLSPHSKEVTGDQVCEMSVAWASYWNEESAHNDPNICQRVLSQCFGREKH